MRRQDIRDQLAALAEPEYQRFSSNLLPGVSNVMGVRLPHLRKIARKAAAGGWRELLEEPAGNQTMEETMIDGMILGYAKDLEWEEFLERAAAFIPRIQNWSVCDSVCSTLKRVREHREAFWDFLKPYLSSEKEFEVRFAAVMLLNFYVEESWIRQVVAELCTLNHEGYYAKMGIAWALSICWISFPRETENRTEQSGMDEEIYQKMLQKIIESTRTPEEEKRRLRARKRQRAQKTRKEM